ncbi:hypothetical protein AbraIFM66951_007441, partial [Aspergillus brasiliensis]
MALASRNYPFLAPLQMADFSIRTRRVDEALFLESPELIVIGAGPSGIALAYTLKHRLGFRDFT